VPAEADPVAHDGQAAGVIGREAELTGAVGELRAALGHHLQAVPALGDDAGGFEGVCVIVSVTVDEKLETFAPAEAVKWVQLRSWGRRSRPSRDEKRKG